MFRVRNQDLTIMCEFQVALVTPSTDQKKVVACQKKKVVALSGLGISSFNLDCLVS